MWGSPWTKVRGPEFHKRHDVVGAGEVDVGEPVELLGQLTADLVDRHLHELGAAAGRAGALRGQPVEVAARVETGRLPEVRVQRRQVLDDVAGAPGDVVVLGMREPAPARDEVFEHHRVAVAGGLGITVSASVSANQTAGMRTGISGARSR